MPVPASTQSTCPAQAMSHPTGSPPAVPPIAPEHSKGSTQRQLPSAHSLSKAASAPGVIDRTGNQTRSRPTGLPLARKGSSAGLKPVGKVPAGGQVKGPEGTQLSVTEMMQWLDSKLAQAVPKQAPTLASPPIRYNPLRGQKSTCNSCIPVRSHAACFTQMLLCNSSTVLSVVQANGR
jgi:hypothetical protein